ncbi:MAG: transporter substrate-binding domain-containing protein, partial [Magnetococcus sp. XQGC-1]
SPDFSGTLKPDMRCLQCRLTNALLSKMRIERAVWLIGCAVWLLFVTAVAAEQTSPLSLVVSDANPVYANAGGTGILDRLSTELFRRVGKGIRILRLPSERALQLANQGEVDGDLFRIPGLENRFPSLIMLPEPWLEMRFVAFTLRGDLRINTWEDLPPLRVAFIRGWQVFEKNIPQTVTLVRADDAPQLFQILGRQRVDLILYDALQGEFLKQEMGMGQARIAGRPLQTSPIHAYLHRRHAHIVPELAAELRKMKQDGTWQQIVTPGQGASP